MASQDEQVRIPSHDIPINNIFYSFVYFPTTTCPTHFYAVLLDYRSYAKSQNKTFDTATPHAISLSELKACGEYQGLNILPEAQGGHIKPGDILLIRAGWTEDYYARTSEENAKLALRENGTWAGVEQSQEVLDW